MKIKLKKVKDKFEISDGNQIVLERIPEMMKYPFWRNQLRKLTLEFLNTEVKRK